MREKIKQRDRLTDVARSILRGETAPADVLKTLVNVPDNDAFLLFPGADMIRENHFGRSVHLCAICNGKSGGCSEDCSFCSQSVRSVSQIDRYPLMDAQEMAERGRRFEQTPVNRYSIVTSGKALPAGEVKTVARALAMLDTGKIGTCASLGIMDPDCLAILRKAGVSRYHHNLETAKSFFSSVCTTHTYEERVNTVRAARAAGMSVCCGGIFGLGETNDQILELALELKELDVDAVPVNFLVGIEGTPVFGTDNLTPLRCLKIIAFLRHALPDKEIIICGGRHQNLGVLHPLVFYAGASGIMTGDYLTTPGMGLEQDLSMIATLGMSVRDKEV